MENENIKKLFNLDESEEIINKIPCSFLDLSLGVLYLTNNYLCFNSIVYYNQNVIIPISEIISMKISKNNKSIIIKTLVKIFSKSNYIFSNFENLEKTYEIINRRLNISNKESSRNIRKHLFTPKERNTVSYFNKKEPEIKFKELTNDDTKIICQKKINLSSKEFFEQFFYPKNDKNDYSYPKFYESLDDHFDIKPGEWENNNEILNEDEIKNEMYSKKREITFCLKVTGIPFITQSNVYANHSFKANDKKKEYFLHLESQSEGVPLANCFRVIEDYEIYPLNEKSCVIRGTGYPHFIENSFFKLVIIKSVNDTFKKLNRQWMNYISNKGYFIQDYGSIETLNSENEHSNIEKKASN